MAFIKKSSPLSAWLKGFIPQHISNQSLLKHLHRMSFQIPKHIRTRNARINQKVLADACHAKGFFQPDTYVENQAQWSAVKFGSFSMDFSGCEILAVCNARLSLGEPLTVHGLAELIQYFEANGAVLYGGFGVCPTAVYAYFKANGFSAVLATDTEPATLNAIGRSCHTVILTVYNNAADITAQIHTMNVSKDQNGSFFLHNSYHKVLRNGAVIYTQAGPFPTLWHTICSLSGGNAAPVCVIGIWKK